MKDILLGIVATFIIIALFGILLGLPVMLLWNWVMPDIFGLATIDFWHALGLALLSSCLFNFGSFVSRTKK